MTIDPTAPILQALAMFSVTSIPNLVNTPVSAEVAIPPIKREIP